MIQGFTITGRGTVSQMNRKKLLVILVLMILIGAMLPVLTACEPVFKLKVVNGTDQILTIYCDTNRSGHLDRMGDVKPSGQIYLPGLWLAERPYQIIAKNDKGETVYSREFDYDELHDAKFEVVIKTPQDK
jgi:hypothetical protein